MTKVFQFPLKTLVDSSNETFKVLQQLEDSSKTELFSRTFFSLNGEGERKVCGNSYKISHRFPEYKNSFLFFLTFLKRFSLEYWFACVFELVDFVLEFFFCFFVNGNYLRIFTSNRNGTGIYLIWFCNVLVYFVYCIRYHGKKSCCLIKIYLKCFIFREIIESKFWRISKERNMSGNKIISLQEFLKKKKITYIKLSSHWKNRYIYSIWNYFFRIKNNLHSLRCSLIINTFLITVLFNKNYSTYHQKR